MASYQTRFGSLEHYEKGGVEAINDDPRHYAFSNVYEVASKSGPYEKVAVAGISSTCSKRSAPRAHLRGTRRRMTRRQS